MGTRPRHGSSAVPSAPRGQTITRAYVDGPDGQIHVRHAGDPDAASPALLCLHLTPGTGRMYDELLVEMARDRFVLAPDTPGYGASDAPPAPPTIAAYARAMSSVLDAYGVRAVDVVGYHTGSKTAVELALADPGRVHSLFLVSAPDYSAAELAAQEHVLASPRSPRPDGSHLVEQFTELARWCSPGTPLELVQREFAEQQRAGERAHWGYLAAFAYHHRDHLPRVRQPVLLLCPADDLEGPTLRAAPLVSSGRFVHRPDWGHQLMVTHTAEVAAMLREHTRDARR